MNRSTRRGLLTALIIAASMHVIVGAQAQIGQNINVITGIDDPTTGDPFRQRHNESVIAISGVNPEHMIVAYNDYSMVDIANDQDVGTPAPAQSAVARLFDLLLKPWRGDRPDTKRRVENVEKASANAWIGWSFSDNGGKNWVRGLHHGHPFEASSPLGAGQLKSYNFQAASDPVLASTHDRFYLAGIAFTPNGGSAGFVSVLTDYNDTETGRNIRYDFTKILLSTPTATHFIDKPSVAALGNKVYAAFVVFDESDPAKLSSKILFFRSTDRGNTWSGPGVVVSNPLTRNQAPWILIDPNNENTVYIGWRVFSAQTGGFTNAIIGKKSLNGGASFTTPFPWPVAVLLKAFDQPQGVLNLLALPTPRLAIPRSNAYPTATIDGNGTIHVALQEWVNPTTGTPLGPLAAISTGVPRITVTSSSNGGALWTPRKAMDFGPNSGTQFMPVITAVGEPGPSCNGFAGPRSRVMVMYYDARASTKTGYVAGGSKQFDVRLAEASACNRDQFGRLMFSASQQLSQYSLDPKNPGQIVKTPGYGYTAVNRAYSMFGGGTKAFTGDYIGLTPRVPYVNTPSGWKLTTASAVDRDKLPAPVVQGVWPDTRVTALPTNPPPVLLPTDPLFIDHLGWPIYAPPHSGVGPNDCQNPGSRSQDVFTAQYAPNGVFAAAPVTFRVANAPRPYPLYVENRFPAKRYFRLTIEQAAAASFNYKSFASPPAVPAAPDPTSDVEIGPFSTVTGTVIVGPGVFSPIAITIAQITALGGAEITGGAKTTVALNPAAEAAASATASYDPLVQQTPTISKPFAGTNVLPRAAGPSNPLPSPYTDNPYTDNPYTDNPYTDNVIVYDVTAASVSVQNGGDASGAYTALLRIQNALALQGNYVFQTFIERVAKNPGLDGCQTVEVHQNTQVSTIKAPYTDNPYTDNPYTDNPYTDNPYTDNPYTDNVTPEDAAARVSNSTFYLAPANMAQSPESGSAARSIDEVRYHLWASQIRPTAQLTAEFNPTTQFSLTVIPETPNVIVLPGGGVGFDPGGPTAGNSGAGVAVKLAFNLQPPPTVGPGHRFTVQVAVQDANSAVVANSTRTVTLALDGSPSGATLSGTLTKNAVNGIATFDDVAVDKIQDGYTLVASSVGVTSAISNSFDVTVNLSDQISVLNTDFVSVGYGGLRGTAGTGTITLSGVSGNVTGALLYWHGPTVTNDAGANSLVAFAGQTVTGVNLGIASDNNWERYINSHTYAANVTSLVTGNGEYALANFVKSPEGISADMNGISLIVFFNDGVPSNNRDVYLRGTNDSNVGFEPAYAANTWNQTLSAINYGGGTAVLELHVADGQGFFDDGVNLNGEPTVLAGFNFQGTSVQNEPAPESVTPGTGGGGLWDIKSWTIPDGVFVESSSVTLSQPAFSNRDYLSLVVMLISVPHAPPPVVIP